MMMMLRWIETALWIVGLALLGSVVAALAARRSYQAEQERVLFSAPPPRPEVRVAEAKPAPRRDAVPALETMGPPALPEPAVQPRIEAPAPEPEPEPAEAAPDPLAIGRIEIPRLGVRAIIREGADEETLDRAVGLVPGAARPGEPGNVVLAGHRDTFFRPLRRIRVDDRIRVVVPPHEYSYRVESVRVVEQNETGVLQSKGVEELTLVTCYPFRYIGPAPERFIVSARPE